MEIAGFAIDECRDFKEEELLRQVKKLYSTWFGGYWSPYLVMALAGILSAVYFGITHTVWAVTGEFTRLGDIFWNSSGWMCRIGRISTSYI